jgi:hypothetical protein
MFVILRFSLDTQTPTGYTARMLKFSPANTKLKKLQKRTGRRVYALSLLSGHNCPFAKNCLSKAIVSFKNGKRVSQIQDGPHTEFRCYSASQENFYQNVYDYREANFNALNGLTTEQMTARIEAAIPDNAEIIRIHDAGDFFSQSHFDAWMTVARRQPQLFYAYTKSLRFWVNRLDSIPENVILTASYGGIDDALIEQHNLRSAKVVYSITEAESLGLEIDMDDSHASSHGPSFALLIHGVQPKK